MRKNSSLSKTRILTVCALLTAMAIVMARILGIPLSESSRISFESIPIFLAGMLFGPLAGALVGFASDFLGSLMMFGFNPFLCIPPILCGICGGLFRPMLREKNEIWRIALAYLPYIVLGAWLWQSAALAWFFGGEALVAKQAFFVTKIVERGIQFTAVFVIDVLVVYFLCKSNLLKKFQT